MEQVTTPLHLSTWEELLQGHPDKALAGYILRGIRDGFRIGFDPSRCALKSRPGNMPSADEHPEIVSEHLEGELQHGRLAELDEGIAKAVGVHISPFGVIPKKSRPNKWRLILDLSSPGGNSINDGISKELASLSYVSVDEVVVRVLQLGRGALMAKMDIKQAYRNIPVHPSDRRLLGMRWKGKTFVDMALPFGLRSAPLIFSAVADALAWIMQQQGVGWVAHYVDDFITVGTPDSGECARYVDIMHKVCEDTAMPVEPEKDEGPATTISFLGLELDSVANEVRLPQNKLQRLRSILGSWRGRKACKKRELLSLIGSLSHACRAVRPGRSYLRRLINLSTSTRQLDQFIRLNREARADMEWWYLFISTWNGTAMMLTDQAGGPTITLTWCQCTLGVGDIGSGPRQIPNNVADA